MKVLRESPPNTIAPAHSSQHAEQEISRSNVATQVNTKMSLTLGIDAEPKWVFELVEPENAPHKQSTMAVSCKRRMLGIIRNISCKQRVAILSTMVGGIAFILQNTSRDDETTMFEAMQQSVGKALETMQTLIYWFSNQMSQS